MTTTPPGDKHAPPHHRPKEPIQDVIISVIIAFTLAFVFRGFVVEAFVIPTGSMAPTLMGAHERLRSKETGYSWPVGPWYADNGGAGNPKPVQGKAPDPDLLVHDPVTGLSVVGDDLPRKSGDRILVLKYLYMLMEPQRFDVVVFKCPFDPPTNYIKRLVGLPGEEIAVVDGDIFHRPAQDPVQRLAGPNGATKNPWADTDWKIARKPVLVQDAEWQTVFDSDYAPRVSTPSPDRSTTTPWTSEQPDWSIGGRTYTHNSAAPTDLVWDSNRLRYRGDYPGVRAKFDDFWEINDRYAYDESPLNGFQRASRGNEVRDFFPVSDLRMLAGLEPKGPGLKAGASLIARSHEFRMDIEGNTLTLRMHRVDQAEWKEIARAAVTPLAPGVVTNVEFWHTDQSVQAWINGTRVAYAEYDWTPDERIRMTTTRTVDELLREENGQGLQGGAVSGVNVFEDRKLYQKPRIKWSFDGAPVSLHRIRVDRDIYYQPGIIQERGMASRGSHPLVPVLLNGDQFFVCGDNSPASLDARLWSTVDPWVQQIDPEPGVVPRRLMLGKAFFVYYPAPTWVANRIPVPDFGRMRFIW